MRWKGVILIALMFFGAGLIVGYSISGQIVIGTVKLPQNTISILLASLFTFMLGLLGGSDFVAFFTNLYKEHKKKRHKHHMDLINNVFRPWSSHKILFNWYDLQRNDLIQFKEFLQNRFGIKETEITSVDSKTERVLFNETFLSLYINKYNTKLSVEPYEGRTEEFIAREEDNRLNIYEIIYINEKKEALALEHLKKYNDLLKLRDEISTIKDNILKEDPAINEYILTKLEQSTLLNFTRDCSSDEDSFIMVIYNIIKDFTSTGGVPDTYKLHPQNNPGTGCAFIFNKTKKELTEHYENSRKQNEIIIKDKTLNEMIGEVVNDKTLLTKKTNEFEQCVEEIIYNFVELDVPLKGTCVVCRKWYHKLFS